MLQKEGNCLDEIAVYKYRNSTVRKGVSVPNPSMLEINLFHHKSNISPGSVFVQTELNCQSLKLVCISFAPQETLVLLCISGRTKNSACNVDGHLYFLV